MDKVATTEQSAAQNNTSKKYTFDEAFAASNKYFFDNELAANVWCDKYAMRDKEGLFLEKTPDQMHDRLAAEFARIDIEKYGAESAGGNYETRYKKYRDAMDQFSRIVPQGSPMCAVGNTQQIMSASNCVVVEPPKDSIAGIMKTGAELAQLFKRRCGVGLDISGLRPDGFHVNNAARTTSGAWSFADYYSYITRLIGQRGRRGALMVTLNVHHPDVESFARMKADLKKVTGANVSIRLSDEFLQAVEDDTTYEQRWPCEDNENPIWTKQVSARQVWETVIETATATAEPGLIFWDKITKRLPAHNYPQFKTRSTNPCCFAKESEVIVTTKEGPKEIKTVTNKDEVWIDSEEVWAKTSGYFDAGIHPTYTVTFDNSTVLAITMNHKLEHPTRGLVELKNLDIGDQINLDRSLNHSARTATITGIDYCGDLQVGCIEVEKYHKFTANGIISGNSEIALSSYDSCRLISLNLTGFVRDAFTQKANFHWEAFADDVHLAMQMIDNLVDIELELIEKIQAVCSTDDERNLWQKLWQAGHDGRRTGLGTHGLGDMLAQLGIKYDSQEALDFADRLYEVLRNNAYMASIELAEKRGAFPAFDWKLEKDNEYIQDLPEEFKERMAKTGRRNIAILTQAPTGSVSIVSKTGEFDRFSVSSGVEPVFRNNFTRRKKINSGDINTRVDYTDALGDNWQNFDVYHSNVLNYFEKIHGAVIEDLADERTQSLLAGLMKELPEQFVTSDQVDWKFRVDLQGHEQHFIDHSISSTINLPRGTTSDVVGGIYLSGWRAGLKGVTVYVDGSRDGVLITKEDEKIDPSVRPDKIIRLQSPKRPKELPCDIHQHTVRGEKWTALVGLLEGEPYEMFGGYSGAIQLPKKYSKGILKRRARGKYDLIIPVGEDELVIKDVVGTFNDDEIGWTTRLMSTSLRHGAPIEFLVEQLSKSGSIQSFSRVLARVLKKYIPDGEKVKTNIACGNECDSPDLIYTEGCVSCSGCGWTKCS